MDLRHFETFCSVIDTGGFTRAADRLFLTQPAVSLQIRQLEQALGAILFERSPKGVVPTPAGEVLYRYAKEFIALAGEAQAEVAAIEMSRRQRVRIGTTDLCAALLAEALVLFCQRHPAVEVAVFEGASPSLLNRVRAGDADLALVSPADESEFLTLTPLFSLPLVAVCRRDHPLATQNSISALDLATYPLAVYEKGTPSRQIVERACSSVDLRPRIAFESNWLTSLIRAVEAGIGATVLPAAAVRDSLDDGTLVALPLEGPEAVVQVVVAARSNQPLEGPALELMEIIRERGRSDSRLGLHGEVEPVSG